MRYLHPTFALQALRRGAAIAQLMPGSAGVAGRATITWWLASRRGELTYVLGRHHVFDEGSPSFFDVWEFSPVDDEELLGVGVDLAAFDSAEALWEAARRDHDADPERWVNESIIQDEYADLRRR